jgi:cytochrome c peroxidase
MQNKMPVSRAYIRFAYFLIPIAFVLMAYIPSPQGNDANTKPTPYDFGMPPILMPIVQPADNRATVEGVALGRKLFYDPALSGNGKQSCANCHKQALAFADSDAIAIGSEGRKAHRNSMSLVNLGWQDKYFWDGRAATLEDLIHFPVTDSLEMHADLAKVVKNLNKDKNYPLLFCRAFGTDTITRLLVTKAISQFLRTIVSYNSPFDRIYRDYVAHPEEVAYINKKDKVPYINDRQLLLNGLGHAHEYSYGHDSALARQIIAISPTEHVLTILAKCLNCHYISFQLFCGTCDGTIGSFAQVQYKNNGLDITAADKGLYGQTHREEDKYLFKVPTFRNVALTGPYMHDGRFKTLEEVVEHYNSGIEPNQNLDTLLLDKNKKPLRFHMTEVEKKQLISLIKLFSDSTVLTDPRYAAPKDENN